MVMLALHAGAPPAPHDFWSAWSREPFAWLGILLLTVLYARGTREAWSRAGRGRVFDRGRLTAAALALGALALALLSPIDALGSALFAGHMVQHLLLVTVAAPLLLHADVAGAVLRSLPVRVRRAAVRTARRSGLWYLLDSISLPGPALLLHAGTLWLWHLPRYYDAAVYSDPVHALEHLTMLGTAILFWRPVLTRAPRARLHGGLAVLYIFIFGMQMSLLGALLTFASDPWYQGHAVTTAAWGLTPLEDQRLAGVIMWVPAGILYLAVGARAFLQWLGEMEVHSPAYGKGVAP